MPQYSFVTRLDPSTEFSVNVLRAIIRCFSQGRLLAPTMEDMFPHISFQIATTDLKPDCTEEQFVANMPTLEGVLDSGRAPHIGMMDQLGMFNRVIKNGELGVLFLNPSPQLNEALKEINGPIHDVFSKYSAQIRDYCSPSSPRLHFHTTLTQVTSHRINKALHDILSLILSFLPKMGPAALSRFYLLRQDVTRNPDGSIPVKNTVLWRYYKKNTSVTSVAVIPSTPAATLASRRGRETQGRTVVFPIPEKAAAAIRLTQATFLGIIAADVQAALFVEILQTQSKMQRRNAKFWKMIQFLHASFHQSIKGVAYSDYEKERGTVQHLFMQEQAILSCLLNKEDISIKCKEVVLKPDGHLVARWFVLPEEHYMQCKEKLDSLYERSISDERHVALVRAEPNVIATVIGVVDTDRLRASNKQLIVEALKGLEGKLQGMGPISIPVISIIKYNKRNLSRKSQISRQDLFRSLTAANHSRQISGSNSSTQLAL